ncbi:MAG: TubC N-terminal docking domain-related protein [Thiotrichales bacterium]
MAQLTKQGFVLSTDGERIGIEPADKVTPNMVRMLRQHKPELLAVLQSEQQQPIDDAAKLARDFYNHLFGNGKTTGCCYAPTGRYCAEGQRLKRAYYRACQ